MSVVQSTLTILFIIALVVALGSLFMSLFLYPIRKTHDSIENWQCFFSNLFVVGCVYSAAVGMLAMIIKSLGGY